MPAANVYTTKEVQRKLMYGIQDVMVRSGNKINNSKSFFGILFALVDLVGVAYRLWKIGKPTHNSVNQYNSHTMIDLRDWFLAHDKSGRRRFYEAFFNLVIIKYDFDGHMGKRLEKWLEKWYETAQDGKWLFTHKHPETEWILNEEDKQEPTYIRQQRLREALHNKEYDKVLNLID